MPDIPAPPAGFDLDAPPSAAPPPPPGFNLDAPPEPKEETVGQRLWRGVRQGAEDVGAGMLESVTGAGELIPGLHPYAAAASDYLHKKVQSPWIEDLGLGAAEVGETLFGGGAKLATLVPQAAKSAGFLNAATRAGTAATKGAIAGGTMGAEAGIMSPTGQQDYGEAIKQKGKAALEKGEDWAIGGGLLSGGLAGAKEAGRYVSDLIGGKAKEAVEALRSDISGEAKGAGEKSSAESTVSKEDQAHLSNLFEARNAEADRLRIATTGAEQAANQIVDELAAQPRMDAKTFGNRVQTLIDDTYRKYVKIREEQSGYANAIRATGERPIDTSSVGAYVDKNLKDIANPTTRNFLSWIKSEAPTTQAPGGAPLTVARADSLRKTLDRIIRTKRVTFENMTTADAAEALHYARDIRSKLIGAMRQASPEWGQAFDKFRELSRPLDVFERKGPLAGLAREDPLSAEYNVLSGDVVGRVLQKTSKGSNAFARLVAEDPELKDSARQFFRSQLFGPEGLERQITPDKLRSFMETNSEALKQTGLFDEFRGAKTSIEAAQSNVDKLASEAKLKSGDANETERLLKQAQNEGSVSDDAVDKYDKFVIDLKDKNLTPDGVVAKAKSVAASLLNDKHITKEDYDDFLGKIKIVGDEVASASRKKELLRYGMGLLALGAGVKGWDLYRLIKTQTGN